MLQFASLTSPCGVGKEGLWMLSHGLGESMGPFFEQHVAPGDGRRMKRSRKRGRNKRTNRLNITQC
jgi:hypothetical protein